MRSAYPLEAQEQVAVVTWGRVQLPLWGLPRECLFAIPNGGQLAHMMPGSVSGNVRAKRVAELRALGMLDGASDLLLAVPVDGTPGLYVEMKRRRAAYGTENAAAKAWRPTQRAFAETMRGLGYAYEVCYGAAEAQTTITNYLAPHVRGRRKRR